MLINNYLWLHVGNRFFDFYGSGSGIDHHAVTNGYAFTYTQCGLINEAGENLGVLKWARYVKRRGR